MGDYFMHDWLMTVWLTTYAAEYQSSRKAKYAMNIADDAVMSLAEEFEFKTCGTCEEFKREARQTGKCVVGEHPVHVFGTCGRWVCGYAMCSDNGCSGDPKGWLGEFKS